MGLKNVLVDYEKYGTLPIYEKTFYSHIRWKHLSREIKVLLNIKKKNKRKLGDGLYNECGDTFLE